MKRHLKFLTLVITVCVVLGSTLPAFAATTAKNYSIVETKTNSIKVSPSGGEEVRGDWWGPTTYFNCESDGKLATFTTFLVTEFLLPSSVAKAIGYAIFGYEMLSDGTPYYGYEYKHYEEIYVNGEFAYFRTTVYVYVFSDADYTDEIGHSSQVFNSTAPMVISQ
ncbi:MAG: hypothetical protein NUV45_04875 [Tepidanaerobacteraceae bacterium]|jgi:hypothetical protein|nr:hypothetical protein [Tepidanaerobacteraceae bacterium]